jgi:glycosyltransferase involved in cell wall biosynthesis
MACRIRSTIDIKLEKKFKKVAASWNILNNITFLNSVENMPSLLNSCDIGIYPSEKRMTSVLEIPLVLLELMALKKPIIFGNIPPLDELMKSKIGVMLSSHSPENYTKEIINLIKKPGLIKETGANGRKTVTKYFNLDTSLKAYKEQYEEIIRK